MASDFWEDLGSVVFYHLGERYLKQNSAEFQLIQERLIYLEEQLTSAQGDVDALNQVYTQLDQATSDIAAKLQTLIDHANSGNVSASDVVAHLTPMVQRLQAMGQDGSVESSTDPTTTTDPTNSPNPDSPLVNPAPDAPTDNPTPDPTVNPTGTAVPDNSQPTTNDSATTTDTTQNQPSDPNAF